MIKPFKEFTEDDFKIVEELQNYIIRELRRFSKEEDFNKSTSYQRYVAKDIIGEVLDEYPKKDKDD